MARNDRRIRGIRTPLRSQTLLGRLSPGDGDVEMLSSSEVNTLLGGGGGGTDTEAVQDIVGAMAVDGTSIDFTYNDPSGTLTAEVTNGSITVAKMENRSESTLLGRGQGGGNGTPQEITLGSGLSLSGTVLDTSSSGTDTEAVQDIVGAMLIISATIQFTYNDTAGTVFADVRNGTIDFTQMASRSASTLIGRNSGSAGTPEEVTLGTGLTMSASGELSVTGAVSPVTTEGDIIVGDNSGDEARLAIGSNGQVLTSNGTTASWQTPAAGGSGLTHPQVMARVSMGV